MCGNNEEFKSIVFDESELCDLESIRKKLFCDENDPRSSSYVRHLDRPSVNWWVIALKTAVPTALCALTALSVHLMGASVSCGVLVGAALLLVYFAFNLKRALICAVKIYQRYAPESIRNKCRFEPSCSEYMILSLQKYGVVKGLAKGIDRLKRCNIDNGGFDMP